MDRCWRAVDLLCSVLLAGCGQTTTDEAMADASGGSASTLGSAGNVGMAGHAGSVTAPPCRDYEVAETVEYEPGVDGDAVVWTGADYALVWSVNHDSWSLPRNWFDIEIIRADRAGNVVTRQTAYSSRTSEGALADGSRGVANVLAAAPANDELAILYCDFGADSYEGQLMFLRLTATGSVAVGPRALAACNGQRPARLVWNGVGFGTVWEYDAALRFIELDPSGHATSEILQIGTEGMIATLHLFWNAGRYGLAWEDVHSALDANRFVTIQRPAASTGDTVLLSSPNAYARDLFVTPFAGGYTALWHESDSSGSSERLLMVTLDAAGDTLLAPRDLGAAPLVALSANHAEHGALLAEEVTVGDEPALSLSFATLNQDAEWSREVVALVPPEYFPRPVHFAWHGSAFDLLFTRGRDDERRLAHLQVVCQD